MSGIVSANIDRETRIHTDESRRYTGLDMSFADHEIVRHTAGEYARGDVNTNTIEGVFGIFRRGVAGIYQHCDEKNLHRCLAEFDFRYNRRSALGFNDKMRADDLMAGARGKCLTCRRIGEARL